MQAMMSCRPRSPSLWRRCAGPWGQDGWGEGSCGVGVEAGERRAWLLRMRDVSLTLPALLQYLDITMLPKRKQQHIKLQDAIKDFQRFPGDVGSSEVQGRCPVWGRGRRACA